MSYKLFCKHYLLLSDRNIQKQANTFSSSQTVGVSLLRV